MHGHVQELMKAAKLLHISGSGLEKLLHHSNCKVSYLDCVLESIPLNAIPSNANWADCSYSGTNSAAS